MVQSERRTQPAEYVDLERQRIRAHNLRENTDHFRVLIIGRANAGKTTILQRVCNTTKQPKLFNPKGHKIDLSVLDPTAKRGEHNIENEMIFDSNPGYVFHDSRGFEAGRTLELDAVKSFIQHRSTAGDIREQLHAIWYCIPINDEARPITRAELNFFDECGTGRVPVIILFTKADLLDAQTIGQLVETGMSIEDAERKAGEESINNFYEKFGHLLLLVKETAAVLSDDTILQLFLSVQQNYLALSIEWAIKRVMFGVQGQWSKYMEKQMITIKGILLHFHHIAALGVKQSDDGLDGDVLNGDDVSQGPGPFLPDADNGIVWVLNRLPRVCFSFHSTFVPKIDKMIQIPAHLALDCVHWSSRSAFLCIATAIIVEHSYFFWKTQPSRSSEPLKKSFHTFQSSAAFKNIQDAIKELDEGHTDVPAAIVKIALDNRLSQ
ncbi:uncharacterized protein LACBIDRAFT_321710 [Laccaria bicolor S238N-H82]|uniref:Predicted protein n=1 Tax=Laccaria bicolor (strain S238N-H82 / ATCC MYA-4686) TaxID=486041 RepID=B0CTW2_LACBS|nr:uncharacterized protein LACBIDRAFT_321710 [Laccaria bicolor S238N-H82]EDR14567.1 predicted protein [Laccaria bicolor S238N-H82]|eukprot:XP_001875126.1 predicted protein [Laccaria bicolor S238N-H82]